MGTKSDILNNLREFTADQIAEAIKAGTVTVYELSKSGNLTPLMRRRIEERLAVKSTDERPSAPAVQAWLAYEPPLTAEILEAVDVEVNTIFVILLIPSSILMVKVFPLYILIVLLYWAEPVPPTENLTPEAV